MRRQGIILLTTLLLIGVSVLWARQVGLGGSFFAALDWTTAAEAAPDEDPPPQGTLQAFGLNGVATCRTVDPPTNSPYLAMARAAALKYKIDSLVFVWKIWQESGFQPDVTSPAGAMGIAQFMPATAEAMGIDPWNPEQALDASARLDAAHIKQYASRARTLARHYGGPSARYGYALALAAYNAGPGSLERAWSLTFGAGWPSSPWAWLMQMALETRHYVPNIINCSVK